MLLPRLPSPLPDLLGAGLLLFGLGMSGAAAADTCGPYPIAARIGNVSLSNSKIARGVDLAIGEPAQHLAFWPMWHLNNTYLWGQQGNCVLRGESTWSIDGCITFRGGAYNPTTSSSKQEIFSAEPYYATDTRSVIPAADRYLEKVTFNTNASSTISKFPLGVALNDFGGEAYYPQQAIGVGSNSTLLNYLWSSGQIMSRTIGFFTGRGLGAPNQMDGSLVFGGYDKAKTTGRAYTQNFNEGAVKNCTSQMSVTIADMVLNFPNGTNKSLFPVARSQMLSACLDPASPTLMRMPLAPYYANWLGAVNTDIYKMDRTLGWYYYNMMFKEGMELYTGDLTITLQSGLSVRIPNDLIIQKHTFIDELTGDMRTNSSTPDWLIYSNQAENARDTPILGMQFFAAAYLMVNLDSRQFTLWEAKPTTDVNLVAVDTAHNDVSAFCAVIPPGSLNSGGNNNNGTNGTSSGTNAGPDGSSTPNGQTTSSASSALSTGAIAGVAVGSVAGVALIAAAAAFFFIRRKRAAAASSSATVSGDSSSQYQHYGSGGPGGPGTMQHSPSTLLSSPGSRSATGSAHLMGSSPSDASAYNASSVYSAALGQYPHLQMQQMAQMHLYPGFQWKQELDSDGQAIHEMPVRPVGPQPGRFYELHGS